MARWRKTLAPFLVLTLSVTSVVSISAAPALASGPSEPAPSDALVYYTNSLSQRSLMERFGLTPLVTYDRFMLTKVSADQAKALRAAGGTVDVLANKYRIEVGNGFDIRTSDGLSPSQRKAPPAGEGTYLVKFIGPIKQEWVRELTASGAQVIGTVPTYTLIARMTPSERAAVAAKSFVTYTTYFNPNYKFKTSKLMTAGTAEAVVRLFPGSSAPVSAMSAMGVRVQGSAAGVLKVKGTAQDLERVAQLEDVASIEPFITPQPFNATSRVVIKADVAHSKGTIGTNEIVAVTDTGIYKAHEAFADSGKIVKVIDVAGDSGGSGGDGYGHGTHVAGSVAGNATPFGSYNKNDGQGFGAKLIDVKIFDNRGGWAGGSDLYSFWNEAYSAGARINTNSWGANTFGEYTAADADADRITWDHKDLTLTIAAGNKGEAGRQSIGSPGGAKNAVTVGASDTESPEELAYFSSRGPTVDGRIKPDVVAPGYSIMSARRGTTNGYESMAGTSMATPQVAGAAAVVRQYLKDGYYPTGTKNAADSRNPSGALLKAMLINGAVEMKSASADADRENVYPNNSQGWGRVDLDRSLFYAGDSRQITLWDEATAPNTGSAWSRSLKLDGGSQEVKFTLVWYDPAAVSGSATLVNDLNLRVTAPDGTIFLGNNFKGINPGYSITGGSSDGKNTVEGVHLIPGRSFSGNLPAGDYKIEVVGANVPTAGSNFAVVVNHPTVSRAAPAAPTGLAAVAKDASIDLTWNANTETTLGGYNIYRATSAEGPYSKLNASLLTAPRYSDTAVSGGTTYYYQVTAVDNTGIESGRSATASATATGTAPQAPVNLRASVARKDVTLAWDTNSETDVVGYHVYRSTEENGTYTKLTATPVSVASFVDKNLNDGRYFYQVTAVNASGMESVPTDAVSTVVDTTPPASPSGLVWGSRDGAVAFNWKANTEADLNGYRVYRSANETGPFEKIGEPKQNLWAETGMADGTYYFMVTATDRNGLESTPSNVVKVTVGNSDTTPPAAPKLTSARAEGNAINLTWDRNTESDLAGYALFRANGQQGPYNLVNKDHLLTSTDYRDANLADGTYFYYLLAVDHSGNQSQKSAIKVATVDTSRPAAPSPLRGWVNKREVTWEWGANTESDLAGYNMYRGLASGGPYTKLSTNLITATRWVDTAPADGTYWYAVTAVDSSGQESAKTEASVPVDTVPPTAPTELSAKGSASSVTLTWKASSDKDARSYWVYRATSVDGPFTLIAGRLAETTCTDPHLASGRYFYVVTAIDDSNNESVRSNLASVIVGNQDTTPPAAPRILSAIPQYDMVRVNWVANSEPDLYGYELYRATNAAGPFTRVNERVIAGETWGDVSLKDGTYYYRLTAVDLAGNESRPSQTLSAMVPNNPPKTPSGLAATVSSRDVTLTWKANTESDLAGYKVLRGTNQTGPFTPISGPLPVKGTKWVDQGLNDGKYYYVVTAVDQYGAESTPGQWVSATINSSVPGGPKYLYAYAYRSGVSLFWTSIPGSDIVGYNVRRSVQKEGPFQKVNSEPIKGVSFRDENLKDGTYYYLVTGVTKAGIDTSPSPVATVSVDLTPPTPPTGLTAKADASVVTLSWTASPETDAAMYMVFRSSSADGPFQRLSWNGVQTTRYKDETVRPGTWYYQVTAIDKSGNESAHSKTVSVPVAPPADSVSPSPPHMRYVTSSRDVVTAAWDSSISGNAVGYNLYRSDKVNGTFARVNSQPLTATLFRETGVKDGTYFYRATAVTKTGLESTPSTALSVTVDTTPPSTPRELTGKAEENAVTLKWQASPETDLLGYMLYRSTTMTGPFTRLTASTTRVISYTDKELKPGLYFYRVSAFDRGGNESAPSTVQVTVGNPTPPPDTTPSAPDLLYAYGYKDNTFLYWSLANRENVAGYNLYRADRADGTFSKVNRELLTQTAFQDRGVPDGIHFYRVTALSTSGKESVPSRVLSATNDTKPPTPPAGLTGRAEGTSVTLTWGKSTENNMAYYLIARATGANGSFTSVGYAGPAETAYTDRTVTPGTYVYRVRAVDMSGNTSDANVTVTVK